ncbi:MAG: GNAT family N-acetyltransferase [Clostridiales bacterium]|nr:GNAT family N-acetyltransferase [Clostridiales bacterium]
MQLITKNFSELTTRELYEILKTRQEIFVVEQNCPYMDIDDLDLDATHIFEWDEATGRVTGCLRVFVREGGDGGKHERDEAEGACAAGEKSGVVAQIGRVVTLVHGQGLGGELLHAGVHFAFHNLRAEKIYLHAQTYATGYYAKEGFRVVSEEFMEDGIPHVEMECVREER